MFTAETAENLANMLSQLQCMPTFHNAELFTPDLSDMLGFQIHCEMNDNGRLAFSVANSTKYPQAIKELKEKYYDCFVYDIRETPVSNKQIYPTTGSDSINDIAPGTITRLMLIESELQSSEENATAIPVFIMRLGEEVEKWEAYFSKMAKNLRSLKQATEKIYENCL